MDSISALRATKADYRSELNLLVLFIYNLQLQMLKLKLIRFNNRHERIPYTSENL